MHLVSPCLSSFNVSNLQSHRPSKVNIYFISCSKFVFFSRMREKFHDSWKRYYCLFGMFSGLSRYPTCISTNKFFIFIYFWKIKSLKKSTNYFGFIINSLFIISRHTNNHSIWWKIFSFFIKFQTAECLVLIELKSLWNVISNILYDLKNWSAFERDSCNLSTIVSNDRSLNLLSPL